MIAFFLCALAAYLGLFALTRFALMATVIWGGSGLHAIFNGGTGAAGTASGIGTAAPASALAMSFLVGLRFDLAVSLYVLAPLFLLNAPFYVAGRESRAALRRFNRVYLAAFFLLFAFLGAVEREFFAYFRTRLNAFLVDWGDNPGFVIRMVWETYPVIPVFVLLALLLWGFVRLAGGLERRCYRTRAAARSARIAAVAVALPLLFLGIRGTIHHKSPLRWGHAYFSPHLLANQLALNGVFTLVDSFRNSGMGIEELREALEIDDVRHAYALAELLTRDTTGRVIDFPLREYAFDEPERRLNIVIVLLENFSMAEIDRHEAAGDSLYFHRMRDEGIYFTRFYSNGFHTYMGLFSALFGMPNVHGTAILKRAEGQQAFSGIVNILAERGWRTLFGVSHDPNFDNMAGFLRGNGMERIISEFDFDRSEMLSTLGVADHRLFEKMIGALGETPEPFLGVILTTNNHGPWVIPEVPGLTFRSTFDYTDWTLRHFLDLAAREPWFGRTLFVITADHGGAIDPIHDLDLQSFHIPCLIYAPGIVEPRVVETVGGHIDLTETILGLLRVDHRTTNLGRDLLGLPDERSRGDRQDRPAGSPANRAPGIPIVRASGITLVQEREMIGLVRDDWYLIDRIGGRESLYRIRGKEPEGNPLPSDLPVGVPAPRSVPANSTIDRAPTMPETARDLRDLSRAGYYVANDMILNRRAGVDAYQSAGLPAGNQDDPR